MVRAASDLAVARHLNPRCGQLEAVAARILARLNQVAWRKFLPAGGATPSHANGTYLIGLAEYRATDKRVYCRP